MMLVSPRIEPITQWRLPMQQWITPVIQGITPVTQLGAVPTHTWVRPARIAEYKVRRLPSIVRRLPSINIKSSNQSGRSPLTRYRVTQGIRQQTPVIYWKTPVVPEHSTENLGHNRNEEDGSSYTTTLSDITTLSITKK